MKKVATVGVDLAKNVFSVHGVDAPGRGLARRGTHRSTVELAQVIP